MSYLDQYIRSTATPQTRYQGLKGRSGHTERPKYEGFFEGKPVSFERFFRERELSDMECQALCDGFAIPVQGLEREVSGRKVRYGVKVKLELSEMRGYLTSFTNVRLRTVDTLTYDPDYRFDRKACEEDPLNSGVQRPAFSKEDLVYARDLGLLSDGFSDEADARMAAMVAAPDLPLIQKVQTGEGRIPVFVPVLYDDDPAGRTDDGTPSVQVERDLQTSIRSEPALLGAAQEMRRLEEEGDIRIAEDLTVDEEDEYEDEMEGYEELPDTGMEGSGEIQEDETFM